MLGTIFTMENDYLSKSFTERGIEVIVPEKETRESVNNIIANEFEYGIIKEDSRKELINIIEDLKTNNSIENFFF